MPEKPAAPSTEPAALTDKQKHALRCVDANFGEISEGTLWYEGNGNPRRTLRSLVARGLLVSVEYLNEDDGYLYARAKADRG